MCFPLHAHTHPCLLCVFSVYAFYVIMHCALGYAFVSSKPGLLGPSRQEFLAGIWPSAAASRNPCICSLTGNPLSSMPLAHAVASSQEHALQASWEQNSLLPLLVEVLQRICSRDGGDWKELWKLQKQGNPRCDSGLEPSRLGDALSHCRGSPPYSQTEMLISSGNTFTDIPRNHVLLATWASLSPIRWTHKINLGQFDTYKCILFLQRNSSLNKVSN